MEKEKSFESDYKDFLELLNKHKVKYLIVGAYATMLHTEKPRATKDIDIWLGKAVGK